MPNTEYGDFIECLFNELVLPIMRLIPQLVPQEQATIIIAKLEAALNKIAFVHDNYRRDATPAEVFNTEEQNNIETDLASGVGLAQHLLIGTGLIEVIQDYVSDIASDMQVADFSEADLDLLKLAGDADGRCELRLLIHLTKARAAWMMDRHWLAGDLTRASRLVQQPTESGPLGIDRYREVLAERIGHGALITSRTLTKASLLDPDRLRKSRLGIVAGTTLGVTEMVVAGSRMPAEMVVTESRMPDRTNVTRARSVPAPPSAPVR